MALLQFIGAKHLLYESMTLPVPIGEVDNCDQTYFIENAFTDGEIDDRLKNYIDAMEHIAHEDVFNFKIERVMPDVGFMGLPTGAFISMMAKSATINSNVFGTDEVKTGSSLVKHFSNIEHGDIEIEFYNPRDNSLYEYLFIDTDGKDIIPHDGTILLPFDYYFRLQIWQWAVKEGVRLKYELVDGLYAISGNVSQTYNSESENTFGTSSVTFEKLEVGGIIP